MLDIPTIYSNLYNLYENKELTPSEDGKMLYSGGVIKWLFYDFYFYGKEQKKEAMQKEAIELTMTSLDHVMTKELSQSELYDYGTYLAPLIKKILIFKPDHLLNEQHSKIKEQLTILRFKDLSNRPIPYEGLKALPENLKSLELEKWIEYINYRSLGKPWFWERWLGEGQLVTAGDVHKVIKILARRWFYEPNFMIHRLRELGCEFFDRSDAKFLLKRARWIHQNMIQWKEVHLELGCNFSDSDQEETLIYSIKKKRQFVILSDNTVRLSLNEIDHKLLWDQVPKAPLSLLSPVFSGDGFQVFDRFDHRMSAPPWKSKKYRDRYIKTMVTFVEHMTWYHYTPKKLSVGSLGWKGDRLYTAEYLTMDRIHVGRIVQFLRDATKDSESVYKKLMRRSKLAKGPEIKFYRQILIDMVEENERSVVEMLHECHYSINAVFERSRRWIYVDSLKFQKEAKELAKKVGSKALLEAYNHHMAFGFVDPSWFDSG